MEEEDDATVKWRKEGEKDDKNFVFNRVTSEINNIEKAKSEILPAKLKSPHGAVWKLG